MCLSEDRSSDYWIYGLLISKYYDCLKLACPISARGEVIPPHFWTKPMSSKKTISGNVHPEIPRSRVVAVQALSSDGAVEIQRGGVDVFEDWWWLD